MKVRDGERLGGGGGHLVARPNAHGSVPLKGMVPFDYTMRIRAT